jgi:hypothetical protein
MRARRRAAALAAACTVALVLGAPPAPAAEQHGFVTFPTDEHQHVDGWDYWWGAADLVTDAGRRYTLAVAYTIFDGGASIQSSYQLFPLQGPYRGKAVVTMDGPTEWGHPAQPAGRIQHYASYPVPGVDSLLALDTYDANAGMALVDRWGRTSLTAPDYRLLVDQDEGSTNPGHQPIRFGADLRMRMHSDPLLAGGTGQWWYGIPQTFKYPSRSFQYMQATRTLSGTFEFTQPDGTVLHERVDPQRSSLLMVHEYDASPEDIGAGLAAAEATQLHPRYPFNYNDDWPWELIFADLHNGAQLMLAVMTFNDTPRGTLRPATPDMPTYQVLATLRLPDGRSVALDDRDLDVEHLDRRFLNGVRTVSGSTLNTMFEQTWKVRMAYRGGTVHAPDGSEVRVPAFDLGFVPRPAKDEPLGDGDDNRLVQRVPFDVAGSYGGCPVHGFAWSELITNWYGQEEQDPWFTGGRLPPVPASCHDPRSIPWGTPQKTTPPSDPPPNTDTTGCSAGNPGTPSCEYDAPTAGGIGASANKTGDWTITIRRPGRPDPIVLRGHAGYEIWPCGSIRKGDHVSARADAPGAEVYAGNPGFCF